MEKYNYRLQIAYDGTCYAGWQIQPNATTIQELLQDAIKTIIKHPVTLIGSGRTDAGVHASGQVAHFKSDIPFDLHRFLHSLNGILPKDIRVIAGESVPLNFHAQQSAVGKIYEYHLCLDKVQDPFRRLYSWQVHAKCNLQLLNDGARLFSGTHDFTSFANEAHSGSAAFDPVRTIHIEVLSETGGVCLRFTGNGFLYKMVRNIVGTLIDVARGKLSTSDITQILEAKDRRLASQAAPPHGLFLVKVLY